MRSKQSDFGATCNSNYASPVEVLNLIVVSKSLPIEVSILANNLAIVSHLSVEAEEKLGTMDSKYAFLFEANP